MNARVAAALQKLSDDVAADTAVQTSAITLMKGLSAQIAALKDVNPDEIGAAIDALAATVSSESTKLADAVVANTPAA